MSRRPVPEIDQNVDDGECDEKDKPVGKKMVPNQDQLEEPGDHDSAVGLTEFFFGNSLSKQGSSC